MGEEITVHVENVDGVVWSYVTPSLGQFPETPLHEVLLWILEQINFGNFRIESDSRQRNVSLVLGLDAAPGSRDTTVDLVAANTRKQLVCVDLAGWCAIAREQGVEPKARNLVDELPSAPNAAYFYTDLWYAFAIVDVLKRIREKTFVFSAPPILGKTTPDVINLLGEATRAFLFRFNRASVALCRACVEALLKDRLKDRREDVRREMQSPNKRGELEALIRVAQQSGLLSDEMADWAHVIRKSGNDVVHSSEGPTDDKAWEVLVKTRGIAEFIHR